METDLFNVTVNEEHGFDLTLEEIANSDIIQNEKDYHLIHGGRSYNARIVGVNTLKKEVTLLVENQNFEISIADKYDLLIEKLGLNVDVTHKINEVKAPMPGLVLQIEVNPGDEIKIGDPLLVLEAMKMENVIKAQGEGIVKAIHVEKGSAVEKGALLIEME